MLDTIPLLQRSWVCLGQPGTSSSSEATYDPSFSDASLLHVSSFSRGTDERDTISVVASSDQVCVSSRSHEFTQALPFWEAFSASEDTERAVTCVCVGRDPEANEMLVAASMDHRIAVWAASTNTSRKWRVHSTVMVDDGLITSIDIHQGKLLIGTSTALSLWHLEQSGIRIWRRLWRKRSPSPIRVARFSPDGSSVAAASDGGQNVLLWSLHRNGSDPPILTQRIYHPYPVDLLLWRHPPDTSSQSDVLISYSEDGVARIWAAVIDEPTRLRLWATLDPSPPARLGHAATTDASSRPFYLEASVMANALRSNIGALERELQMMELGLGGDASQPGKHAIEMATDMKRTRLRRLQQLLSEAPDMFMRFGDDDCLSVTAVANIDRRPPTLLQMLTVLKVPFSLPLESSDIVDVALHPHFAGNDATSEDVFAVLQIRTASGAIAAFGINPALFFDGRGGGLSQNGVPLPSKPGPHPIAARTPLAHRSRVSLLRRSSDGRFLCSASATEALVWDGQLQREAQNRHKGELQPLASPLPGGMTLVAISDDGSLHASFSGHSLVIKALAAASTESSWTTITSEDIQSLNFIRLQGADHLVSFSKAAKASVWRVSRDASLHAVQVLSEVLPWSGSTDANLPAAVVSIQGSGKVNADGAALATVSHDGVLERWSLRSFAASTTRSLTWHKASVVQTEAQQILLASCAASGLNALVSLLPDGKQLLSVYDSRTSTFTSGLECKRTYGADDRIVSLDWSPSTLSAPSLAVAFAHRIELLGPSRTSVNVDDKDDAALTHHWDTYAYIDIRTCTPSKLRGMCWLANDRIALASASSVFVYGPTCASDLTVRPNSRTNRSKHLAEMVADRTGPLPQYHPVFLQECLLWNSVEVARAIIGKLRDAIARASPENIDETWDFTEVPLASFTSVGIGAAISGSASGGHNLNGTANSRSVFDEGTDEDDSDDELTGKKVDSILKSIDTLPIPRLSQEDAKALAVIARTIGEAQEQRRSLDDNGLRYLMSLRLLLNRPENRNIGEGTISGSLSHQDTVWAFHSDSQEPLLAAIEAGVGSKLTWTLARSTGLFLWLKSHTALRAQAENVARAQFMVGEDRDPVKCSLLYFALGKPKVVLGLWKQAVWHPEQKKMLQFLSNDFTLDRWKVAAQKNAFALLSQRRYEFAASFFMLGESLQDAVNVCVRNLNDLSLAVALARIREGNDEGPVFRNLLQNRVLVQAFEKGQRWLGSWAFWMLKRRDLAVRIIVSPLSELLADPEVAAMLPQGTKCSEGDLRDASLAILFKQLKNKSVQTLKGTAAISDKTEFDFVLHTNRMLCRMGCHTLGLNVLRTWEFEPPVVASSTTQYHAVSKQDLDTLSKVDQTLLDESQDAFLDDWTARPSSRASPTQTLKRRGSRTSMSPPNSPTMARRRSSLLRRRSSILNDLDLGSTKSQHPQQSSTATDGSEPSHQHGQQASAPVGTSTIFQHQASTSTADPESTPDSSARIHPEPQSMDEPKAMDPQAGPTDGTKAKGVSVFKSAAASNASQGAQEFDFGSFGF